MIKRLENIEHDPLLRNTQAKINELVDGYNILFIMYVNEETDKYRGLNVAGRYNVAHEEYKTMKQDGKV